MKKRKAAQMIGFAMLVLFIIGFLLSLIYSIEADKISRLMKFIGVSCYVIVMSLFLAYPLKMKD